MKPYILTPEQLAVFNNYMGSTIDEVTEVNSNKWEQLIAETIIPATQAYLDNLMAHQDDLTSVDTSSIAASPNVPVVSRLMSLVQTQTAGLSNPWFSVCSYGKEGREVVCRRPGAHTTRIWNGMYTGSIFEVNTLSIRRTDGFNPWGDGESNTFDILIGNGQVLGLTANNQIVFQ